MELQKIYSEDTRILTAFAESRIGGRPENQDSYGWKDTSIGYLVTVCDGMGGGVGGKTASTIAVKEIIAGISEANEDEEVSNIIIKAIRRANMAIIEAGNADPSLKGMGTTATVLLVSDKSAHIAHVGDSRVYQLRDGKKIFRTFDHSMVFEMVSQGIITEEQARLSAQSNIITRALGIKPDVEVEIHEVSYNAGDRFLLCSDGIHGTMPEEILIKKATSKKNKLGALTDDIATMVDNEGRTSGGGHDNLTIAILETKINSKLRPKMSKQTKITMLGLIALLVLSLAINIVQCCGMTGDSNTVVGDSLKQMNDSVVKQNGQIEILKKSISDIDTQVSLISASNIAPIDSIKKIIKKNK
jgi:protein phosphatase